MVRRRERFPYEWYVAISGAVALAISPWGASIPFSGLFAAWSRWVAEPLLGWHLGAMYDGFVSAFLPILGAASLSYPILAFCSQVLETPRYFVWVARAAAVLMFLLAGMAIVDATVAIGTPWELAQLAVACGIGILLATFGIRLQRERVLSPRIRLLGVTFLIAGGCIASFVLLPVGLLALFVTYIVLAIVLAQREAPASPVKAR